MTPRSSTKGSETRQRIVETAAELVSLHGLAGLSIGDLAQALGMSKSGLFAHFGSKEALQAAVLEEAGRRFNETVLRPAENAPPGLARIRAMFAGWLRWMAGEVYRGGCPLGVAMVELDDQPGSLRDMVVAGVKAMTRPIGAELREAEARGELPAGIDRAQFVFEMSGILSSYGVACRIADKVKALRLAEAAFNRLLAAPPRL
jgi:AcrR family transcriptional regulator